MTYLSLSRHRRGVGGRGVGNGTRPPCWKEWRVMEPALTHESAPVMRNPSLDSRSNDSSVKRNLFSTAKAELPSALISPACSGTGTTVCGRRTQNGHSNQDHSRGALHLPENARSADRDSW